MISDAKEFGEIVDSLVGLECEKTLVTSSLKLRFGVAVDPKGLQFIWIDPPWQFYKDGELVTESSEYFEDEMKSWFKLLAPLNRTVFKSWWQDNDSSVFFQFSDGYLIRVPLVINGEDDDWYDHWYAADFTT